MAGGLIICHRITYLSVCIYMSIDQLYVRASLSVHSLYLADKTKRRDAAATGAVPIAKLEDSEKFIGFTSISFHKRSNIEGRHIDR
jgi:hypothetical protein